jgi:lysozyme
MEITGIDVSHYQGTVDWFALKSSGASFAFAKATEGLNVTDAQFATNWRAIKQAGLFRGAYHFGRPGSDPDAQALHFHSVVDELGWGDLPPVLDVETDDGHPPASVLSWVLRFVARAEALFSRPVMIYTGGFWRHTLGDPSVGVLATRPLWLANYRDGAPLLPRTWSAWTFWQYTDGVFGNPGPAPGVTGPCDRDRFVGDLAALSALTTLRLPPLPISVPPGATSTPASDSAWPGSYLLWPSRPVISSSAVRTWQDRMRALGYSLQVDGLYGPSSKAVCMSFQRDHGLSVDGIVGPKTWSASFAS